MVYWVTLCFGLLGVVLTLLCARDSHRWTLYTSRQTGPEFVEWWFDADQLIYDAKTKDQQRVTAWLFFHPSYYNKDKVQAWLLIMKATDELFAAEKLPKGCVQFSGHTFDSLFSKSLERFAFYYNSANLAKIKTHLDSLKAALDARPPEPEQLPTIRGTPESLAEEEKEDVQITGLKQEVLAKDDERREAREIIAELQQRP